MNMKKKLHLSASLVLVALMAYLLFPHTAVAQEPVTVDGQVVNGSDGGDAPAGLEVTLHIFRPEGGVETLTTVTDSDGAFFFDQVPTGGSERYAVSATYQDVTYGVEPESLLGPTMLEIFDITENLSSLSIDSHIWIIREVNEKERVISAAEIVLISNDQDLTFRPVLDPPSSMNFLRFSVPSQASTLEVQSDLQGGDIIDVGTGFGMTSPVPPGSHQIAFTYSFPYSGGGLSLSRSFLQGTDVFRVLIPEGLGKANGPELSKLESTVIGDTAYRVWEARDLPARSTLFIELTNLSQPSLWQRISSGFSGGQAFRIGIPSALGLGLLVFLIYALMFRRDAPMPAPAPGPSPSASPRKAADALVAEVAQLDDLFEAEKLAEPDYRQRRAELKQRLLEASKSGSLGSKRESL